MTLVELFNRLRDRFRRDELSRQLADELRFHQTMLERDHLLRDVTPVEARRRAALALKNSTFNQERTRDTWSLGWLDDLGSDLRFASRVLRRNPAFSLAVVITLALGIGANAAIFSVVNGVLLRPLPYAKADRVFSIWTVPSGTPTDRNPTSYPSLLDWQKQNTAFEGIGGYVFNRFEVSVGDGVDVVRAILGSPQLYEVLQASPMLGRLPRVDEDRTPVVTVSHKWWKSRLNGDPAMVGKTIRLNDQPYTVIGVMPPGFHFPTPDVDLWMSMYQLVTAPEPNPWITSRGLRGYRTVGRLKSGVTPAAAEAQLNQIQSQLARDFPQSESSISIRLQSIREDTVRGVERALWLILGATGLVLLLACANVAHLMMARTSTRARELGIRRALGAHRGRVTRQLMTESLLLSAVGGALGLLVAVVGTRLFVRLSPADMPRIEAVSVDLVTVGFAAALSTLTGLLFGLAPAIGAWTTATHAALRTQARGAVGGADARIRSVLMSAEIAFALVLLVGAGLMVRSFTTLIASDLGFSAERVAIFNVTVSPSRYPKPADNIAAVERVLDRVRAVPGVEIAGVSTSMPPTRMQQMVGYQVEGTPALLPGQEPMAIYIPSSAGFLQALSVRLISGRFFASTDNAMATRVAIINRELAKREFEKREAVGHRIAIGGVDHTIVGVVDNVTYQGVSEPVRPTLYVPWGQSPAPGAWVALKTSSDPAPLMPAIRAAVRDANPSMNARELRAMEAAVGDSLLRPRFQTWLLATFGALGLMLAAVGVYGVIAYAVSQRTSEIGLRLAIGASPGSVVGMLVRRSMVPVAVGLGAGLVISLIYSRVMASLLGNSSPRDLLTFITTTVLLTAVAVAAAYFPAARASRMDPLTALRAD